MEPSVFMREILFNASTASKKVSFQHMLCSYYPNGANSAIMSVFCRKRYMVEFYTYWLITFVYNTHIVFVKTNENLILYRTFEKKKVLPSTFTFSLRSIMIMAGILSTVRTKFPFSHFLLFRIFISYTQV